MKGSDLFKMYRHYVIILLLLAAVIVVFQPLGGHEFVNYDDNDYVTENLRVQAGLTPEGFRWAFTAAHSSNWHPLTWLSHMLDVELFGMDAGRHHLVSLLLHLVNTALLYLVLYAMTGAAWRSAAVAALFGFHPLHVESVAWAAERKDVLSTFFWLLAMAAYLWYVRRGGAIRYLSTVLVFTIGLLAKPMLVTIPFVFLLLDFWPLGRLRGGRSPAGASRTVPASWRSLLWEKTPLFLLTAASCVITYSAQRAGGAVKSAASLPFGDRLGNAVVSYGTYIWKTLWPARLAVFYPHPGDGLPWWQVASSAVVLAVITGLVCRFALRRPSPATGWFWYLGTLVPVIGLAQVGEQAMADRYTYVPLIGLFIMAAWGIHTLLPRRAFHRALPVLSLLVFATLMTMARIQVGFWQNDLFLFGHAIDVTSRNYTAHHGVGRALSDLGKTDEAVAHYQKALAYNPLYDYAYVSLGAALIIQGRCDAATGNLLKSLELNPRSAVAHFNLGICYSRQGKLHEAARHLREAVRLNPEFSEAHNNLGSALFRQRSFEEAGGHFAKALEIDPFNVLARFNLGLVLVEQQRIDEAAGQFREVLRLRPGHEGAKAYLEAIGTQR